MATAGLKSVFGKLRFRDGLVRLPDGALSEILTVTGSFFFQSFGA